MAAAITASPSVLATIFEPIEPVRKENVQTRIAQIFARILQILSDASINDQEKTSLTKKEIKKLSGELANASTWQGQVAVLSALTNVSFVVASCFASKEMQQVWFTLGGTLSDTTAKFLNSRTEAQSTLKASERDILMKELEKLTNESASKQGFKQEASRLLEEALQVAKSATRF